MYVEFRMKKIFIILNLILMFILCIIIYSIFNNYTFIKNVTKIEVNTLKDSYQVECYLGLLDNNPDMEITHLHLNDGTVAGMRMKHKNCFSVQYHPEASPGPHDSSYLFDQFIENIKK